MGQNGNVAEPREGLGPNISRQGYHGNLEVETATPKKKAAT
jgi:hypothetical protein